MCKRIRGGIGEMRAPDKGLTKVVEMGGGLSVKACLKLTHIKVRDAHLAKNVQWEIKPHVLNRKLYTS